MLYNVVETKCMFGEIASQQSKPRVKRSLSSRETLFALLSSDLLGYHALSENSWQWKNFFTRPVLVRQEKEEYIDSYAIVSNPFRDA